MIIKKFFSKRLNLKQLIKLILPQFVLAKLRIMKNGLLKTFLSWIIKKTIRTNTLRKALNKHGLNLSLVSDYYSPLPIVSKLQRHKKRWFKPSELIGFRYNLDLMRELLLTLLSKYSEEYKLVPNLRQIQNKKYGPGFNNIDAMVLYFMIRGIKPKRYIEIGSGFSTFYSLLAGKRNAQLGNPLDICCIDPYPYKALYSLEKLKIIKKEVQDMDPSFFNKLNEGDILFIDSSHIIKVDGDVPYLYLEIIPRLKKGVFVHIHDIPFPYNVPFPPQLWIFKREWPFFWNEAMILQAFLCFNNNFKILLSLPLLRFYDEKFLYTNLHNYESLKKNPNTFSSLWLKKIK